MKENSIISYQTAIKTIRIGIPNTLHIIADTY